MPIPIAQLRPSVWPDTSTTVGQVALIWPYSSSNKSFGLLIVEPDYRLRRERGQVHVDFADSSAKVVARSGVKIGDEVLLSLVGVEWNAATPRIPGGGIDWTLSFRERLVLQVLCLQSTVVFVLNPKKQLSRNSQELTFLDIDNPSPSPEPLTRSPIRSPSTSARTRSRIDSETGTQSWSSPAFLKPNQLAYATYLNTQYDPFRDESIGERRKKLRLGRNSYQWTFANKTPNPDKEDQLEVYESRDGMSPGPAEGADDGPLTSAALQLGPTKPKSASTNDLGHDKITPQLSEDEAMMDEFASENLAGHDPQASFDINSNGHSSLNEEALPGVADQNPPDGDADSKGPIRQGPDRQQIRPESSEVSIQGEDRSRILAEDHQHTPTRIDSSIRQVSSPKDATHSSSNRDPVKTPPVTEYIEKLGSSSDSGEVNMQNEGASRTFAGSNQSTPTRRDSSIRQASSPNDATYSSSNRDPVETPPVTEDIERQASSSDSGEVDLQNEDVSRTLTENHPSTLTRRDSSIRKASSPSDASNSSSNRDFINKPPNTEDIEIQESGSELGEVNMLNKDAFRTFADGLESTPISRLSSVRRESPNDEKQNLFNKDSVSKSSITQRLDRQDPPSESSEDSMQNEDASQVLAEDHQTSPIRNDSSVEQGSPNPVMSKSPNRDSDDDLSMAEGLGRQELQAQTSDADMKNIEHSQNVLKIRRSSFVSRDSSISGDSLSNGATDKLPEQIIGVDSLPKKGNDGQELYSARAKDTVEEEMAPQALLDDRLGRPASEVSSAHRHAPLEDSKIQTSQKLKLSQPKRQASTSGSPESVFSMDVTSQSLADSQVPIDFESENDSSSVRDSISDSSEAISAFSPLQSPYANQEDLSYHHSGLESEGEVVYTGSGDHTPPENYPNSQVITSSEDYDSSNITDEDITSINPRFGLNGSPVSQIRFTGYNLPLSRHDPENVPTLPENSITPTETVAGNMEEPKHEPFVTDEEANPGLLIMKADNISPDEEVGKGGEENENMRPMTLYEDHAYNTFRESHPNGIEGEFPRVQNMNRFSADVFAAESGGDVELDNETKVAVLHEPPCNHSQDENRDLERHISTWEEEYKISPDDDHSPPAQDNESQVVQKVPIVDIIDLEREDEDEDEEEEEDDIASTSPQVKVDPSQSIVDFRKTDDINSEDGSIAKFESERFSSEGHLENHVGEAIDAGQVAHDAPMSLTSIKDSQENVNLPTDQANKQHSNRDSPAIDASDHMKISTDSEYDSGIHKRDPGSSPQSATSALEEALLGDTNFDPILRSQLFTPLSSQQRSLKSEQSIVSEKNQQLEHEIPTPRPTQSTSALPLPSTTPEPQKKPSVIEKNKAMETLSAEKANARKSVDHSKAASNWFTRKKPSHLTHVSDSEDERESGALSEEGSIVDETPPETKPSLEPFRPHIFTDDTPQNGNIASTRPPTTGFRTAFAYYAPLSTLRSHFGTLISVLTILHSVDLIKRSKSGPRDFYRSLSLSDPSTMHHPPTIAQIFRPKELALPIVNPGDAILLRNFKVQSFEKRLGLLSTDCSAWAVFRKGVEMEVRGPPVEFGPEERGFIKGLWKWWQSVGATSVEIAMAEATESAGSVEREYEDELNQRSKGGSDSGRAKTRRSGKGKFSGRARGQMESDVTPVPESGRHQLRDGTSYPDSTPESRMRGRPDTGFHELRDGTSYPDSTPERRVRGRSAAGVHELRDGTTYTDTDVDADADADTDSEKKGGRRVKTKRGTWAKPTPAAAEKDGIRVRRGTGKKKGEHELRDGTRYSDSLE